MPFTPAHPLAVAPLIGRVFAQRLRLDPTCLVIGSMSPDFEYFARVRLVSRIGHTLPGLVLWCLPVTLLCAWLFHRVVKAPAVRVLPRWFAARTGGFAERPWPAAQGGAAALGLVVSALLGAISHDLWDGITHREMWGPQHISALNELYAVPGIGLMPLCRILQHTSTVVGLVGLTLVVGRALRRVQPLEVVVTGGRLVWLACTAVATIGAYARIARRHETDIGSLTVAACCGLLGGALLAGVIARFRPATR